LAPGTLKQPKSATQLGDKAKLHAKYAEAVFGTLGPDAQRAFPLVMRHLVTLGQGEEEVPKVA
jgi:hypothetical protein